ncbi:MAG TPA: alpha-amylase family glycosyl hydrolase [Candidatus Dormibacteraeota bacterium]|nr:alpha-amylase family glycosyl hydrolase [Candidatus Dormibacteraeota bacterium]
MSLTSPSRAGSDRRLEPDAGPDVDGWSPRPDDWWRHGVIYQIYPRSFADSNGDGVGDLAGITAHLDHLNDGTGRSLGIDAIWLSPFYPSPMADFGYDISDYRDIDPAFGTLADFDCLVAEAHARGIRVIVDLVPNHTSDRHPWFVESRSSRTNPRRDWYVWADPAPGGGPPNDWRSHFERIGPAWTYDERTGQYYLHSFHSRQPDLAWWNPQVRGAFEDILRFWLDRGVDGFRIDVADRTVKVRDLTATRALDQRVMLRGEPDRTPVVDEAATHELLKSWRRILDDYGGRMAVGEVATLDPEILVTFYGTGDELSLGFNFEFLHRRWSAAEFRASVDTIEALLPAGSWPCYTLSNHDVSRHISRFGGPDRDLRARLAAMMLLTLRGTPFLYYGEEIGMADVRIPPDRVVDVAGRDPERTPMQWSSGPGAGFTSGRPWLPIGDVTSGRTVEDESRDPRSLLSLYRRLIWYRRRSEALRAGTYRPLDVADPDVFAFLRDAPDGPRLVLLHFAESSTRADLSAAGLGTRASIAVSTDPDRPATDVSLDAVELGPDEGLILVPEASS